MPERSAPPLVHAAADELHSLRRHTPARIALGRAGAGLPTAPHLRFALDHARARDAVWSALDTVGIAAELSDLGLAVRTARTQAITRDDYVRRPDLGRRLQPESRSAVGELKPSSPVALVVADGLSAAAVHAHALPVLRALLPRLGSPALRPTVGVVVEHGRVAIGDDIAEALGAELVAVFIGERPGLSAADSLGCYITWGARLGTPDSRRNCVSNIRDAGLPPAQAALKIAWLIEAAVVRRLSGVGLKDESGLLISSGSGSVLPPG